MNTRHVSAFVSRIPNQDTPSYGELATSVARYVAVGYCSSKVCAGKTGRVEKQLVRRNHDRCPDCNHFLFFGRKKKE